MRTMQASELTEFVALSKCLGMFTEFHPESQDDGQWEKRKRLGFAIVARMQQLLGDESSLQATVPGDGPDEGPLLCVKGDRAVDEEDQLEAERQLVTDRVFDTIFNKLRDLSPDDCPGTMIDVIEMDGTVQAYILPDAVGNDKPPKLNIFKFHVDLVALP